MADPLGLVFSGQDATGAAFKAPWTSYDPYQAEVMAGQNKLAMMQKKRELDEKKKEEALKIASLKAPNWTKYIGTASDLQSTQSDWITKAFAEGRQGEVEQAAALLKTFNQGFTNAVNSNYTEYLKADAAVKRDRNALTDVAFDNFKIFENPELATDNYYPGVAEAYNRNLEVARQRMSTLPKDSYSEDAVKSYAALLTQNEKRSELLQVPRQYPITEWMPSAISKANYIFEKSAKGDVAGKIKTLTKEVKEQEAKRILDDLYQGDIRFENQMRYEFNNNLTPEEQVKYDNPRKYAQERYYIDLVQRSEVETPAGGSNLTFSFGAGAGAPLTTEEIQSRSFDTPVGRNEQGGTTTTVPVISSVPFNIAGTSGILDAVSPKYYYDFDYETGAFATGAQGTSDFATLKKIPTAKSFKFVLQNAETVPVTAKDLKFTVGNQEYTIPAGQILTRETVNLLNKYNVSVGKSDVKFAEMVKGTRQASDIFGNVIQKTTYVPLEMIKGEIENQYKKANAAMPQIQTDPRSPVDVFGLIPGTTISGTRVSTGGGSSSGATRATFNPADF